MGRMGREGKGGARRDESRFGFKRTVYWTRIVLSRIALTEGSQWNRPLSHRRPIDSHDISVNRRANLLADRCFELD